MHTPLQIFTASLAIAVIPLTAYASSSSTDFLYSHLRECFRVGACTVIEDSMATNTQLNERGRVLVIRLEVPKEQPDHCRADALRFIEASKVTPQRVELINIVSIGVSGGCEGRRSWFSVSVGMKSTDVTAVITLLKKKAIFTIKESHIVSIDGSSELGWARSLAIYSSPTRNDPDRELYTIEAKGLWCGLLNSSCTKTFFVDLQTGYFGIDEPLN